MFNLEKTQIIPNDPLLTLKNYGAFYQCPEDSHGNFLGPLVAYAGTYVNEKGETKNFVGNTYFNIARIEPDPAVRDYFSRIVAARLHEKHLQANKVVGMAMGGIKFSQSIGDILGIPSVFAEKKAICLADPSRGLKEESELIISRHEINEGEKILIIEDLCNSFSTTNKAINLIHQLGGQVIGIACVVNRSEHHFWNGLPVIAALEIPSPQYKQEDEKVSDLVQSENVIWKAKYFWSELKNLEKK